MSREQRSESRDDNRGRTGRVPLGAPTLKLTTDHLDIPDNKVPRWISNKPGRIAAAERGGWKKFCMPNAHTGDGQQSSSNQLGTEVTVGSGDRKLYLMVIDKDLYEADQKAKQDEIDEIEKAIKRGNVSGGEFGNEKRYVPERGIDIRQSGTKR